MSRVIVKNLPKRVNEARLREHFSTKGTITDLQLKYTKDGVFRRFAFIGFKDEEQATAAKKFFDGTYLDTSRLEVDICRPLGATEKPRSWSKYSKDSSAYQKLHPDEVKPKKKEQPEKPKAANFAASFLKDLEGNEEFEEFLEVHKSKSNKAIWSNDTLAPDASKKKPSEKNETSESGDEESSPKEDGDGKPKELGTTDSKERSVKVKAAPKQKPSIPEQEYKFTVKVKGLPYSCKKKQIKDFFKPAKVASLRVPPKVKGIAYLGFKTEKEMKQALNRHKSFMGGHRIDVKTYTRKVTSGKQQWREFEDLGDPTETLADTGRVYIRNLAYTVTENDIEELFKKYGPVSEVHLSMDRFTRKPKGFAFVTYLFPEHAIKAFLELDGKLLQGRLLHLLPAKVKRSEEEDGNGPKSYKDKKAEQQKKTSGSSHNWNTLFLGANAVADVMADRYDTSKGELFGTETGDSVAVRMALGETQIVSETRTFLEKQGVVLDAFSRPAIERSKTVILAKNLPAKTEAQELRTIFSKFGTLSRVVLPPWGITALIEFQEPSEARAAFRRLAYSKFKDSPLYLEWAPTDVFSKSAAEEEPPGDADAGNEVTREVEEGQEDVEGDREEDEISPPEPDATVFVKNLNFATTEEALRKHFSSCGAIFDVTVAKKMDPKNKGQQLSMGYGFVQFQHKRSAKEAIKELQRSELDGHALELKISKRETQQSIVQQRKLVSIGKGSTKILVRNVPFEATKKEIKELFSVFGTLRDVRLPKKVAGTGKHRGFAFVDFLAKNDAKRAFKALCQSTHLYGRRLVLEWASVDDDDVDELRRKTAEHFINGPSRKRLKKSELQASLDGSAAHDAADSS